MTNRKTTKGIKAPQAPIRCAWPTEPFVPAKKQGLRITTTFKNRSGKTLKTQKSYVGTGGGQNNEY